MLRIKRLLTQSISHRKNCITNYSFREQILLLANPIPLQQVLFSKSWASGRNRGRKEEGGGAY